MTRSATLAAPAAADAVARARRLSGLRVGLHLAVVGAPPALAPAVIPRLMGADDRLRAQSVGAGAAFFLRPRVRDELAREIRAQFQAFAATGLALDHVNSHQHMHLHPTVARLMLEIGRGFHLRAVRVPDEPLEVLARAAPDVRPSIHERVMRPWVRLLRRRLRRAGLRGNDHLFGIHWSGAMDEERVLALLPHLPEGVTEMYFHPRLSPAPGSHAGPADLAAIESTAVRARLQALGIELTTYGTLA